jgi:hypothetical protein
LLLSGKLTETFPLALQGKPAYLNVLSERDEVRYGESIFVGYQALLSELAYDYR